MRQEVHQNIRLRHLGLEEYFAIWSKMRSFTLARTATTLDEIWLLEHAEVFTQGQAGRPEHILNPGAIPVVATDRGGQVTYHGPGQLIAYVLFDLKRAKIGVSNFVTRLENATVNALADFGVAAMRKADAPGIYLKEDGAKIGSLGLKITRGASYHGLALNVLNDLEPFKRINPCGFADLKMARLCDLVPVTMDDVKKNLAQHLIAQLTTTYDANNRKKH